MSRFKLELCSCIIKDTYGELVEKVAMFLAKNGPSQLKAVTKRTGCSVKQVSAFYRSLRCHVFSRHNIVVYARILTYNDEVLWPEIRGAVAGLSNLCRDAETDAETVFTPETPRRTPRHFERRRDGRRDKGFCDTISIPN